MIEFNVIFFNDLPKTKFLHFILLRSKITRITKDINFETFEEEKKTTKITDYKFRKKIICLKVNFECRNKNSWQLCGIYYRRDSTKIK